MKYKLIIEPNLLKTQYQTTLHKTLLVCPDVSARPEPIQSVKDLLKFAYASFQFAFHVNLNSSDLYISTDDDFLLPPNALVSQALDVNQVIRLNSIQNKLKEATPCDDYSVGLFNVPKISQPVEPPKTVDGPKQLVPDSKKPKSNRRKEQPQKLLGK